MLEVKNTVLLSTLLYSCISLLLCSRSVFPQIWTYSGKDVYRNVTERAVNMNRYFAKQESCFDNLTAYCRCVVGEYSWLVPSDTHITSIHARLIPMLCPKQIGVCNNKDISALSFPQSNYSSNWHMPILQAGWLWSSNCIIVWTLKLVIYQWWCNVRTCCVLHDCCRAASI